MLEMIALPVLALGAGLLGVYQSHRSFRLNGQAVASSCGLQVEETSDFWSGGLSFKARAGPIRVQIFGPRRKGHGPQLVVVAPWPLDFSGVRIRPELEKPFGAREVEIGDDAFDSAFYIVGSTRLLLALLDAETRRLMIAANTGHDSLQIVGGELRAEAFYPQMTGVLRCLLEIARRFSQPLDIAESLAANARQDPNPEVRLRNLLFLVRELPGNPATEALRAACSDASPKVRLRAAKELGAEARGTLLELAESPEDDAIAAQAIWSLRRDLPLERARAILIQALRRRRLQTAHACLERLGHRAAAEDVDTLAKVITRENSELAAAAAHVLGGAGHPAAEPPLIAALHHERTDVRLAAAKALGRAGSAAAVLPLKEAAERSPRDQDLLRATRQSIAEIKSRLQGASPGQLSLAGAEAGKLSLAETEAGQLSLAEEQGRELSLPENLVS